MSDIPPYQPDPTRDTTGEAAIPPTESSESTEPAGLPEGTDDLDGADGTDAPAVGTAYDTSFGLEQAPESSWVPPRAGEMPTPPPPPADPTPTPDVSERLRTVTLPGAAGRALGGRLQSWHVVAVMVGVFVPLGLWAVTSLADTRDPIARPVVSITRNRPVVTPPVVAPTVTRSVTAPTRTTPGSSAAPTRSVMASPPKVVTVPAVPVTPVPANAKTIRFETNAENGARIEVSLSDAKHQRVDYPAQSAPLAFEAPVDAAATSNDYFSLRVRTSDSTGSGTRGAVSCRILVDGVVVTAQQGQGYATCYISPYYDIRRR